MISLFDTVENTGGKGENAGYQHFLHFPECFPKPSIIKSLKVGIVWYRVNTLKKIFVYDLDVAENISCVITEFPGHSCCVCSK